jgi:hypothetical protein
MPAKLLKARAATKVKREKQAASSAFKAAFERDRVAGGKTVDAGYDA